MAIRFLATSFLLAALPVTAGAQPPTQSPDLFGPEANFTGRDQWRERLARSPRIAEFTSVEPDCASIRPDQEALRLRVVSQPGGDPIREVKVYVLLASGEESETPLEIFSFINAAGVAELNRTISFTDRVAGLRRIRGFTVVANRFANRRINQRYRPFLQIRLGDSESTPVTTSPTDPSRWRFENFATVSADTFNVTAEVQFDDGVIWRDILVLEDGTRSAPAFRPTWGGWFWMSDVYLETRQRVGRAGAAQQGWVVFRANGPRDHPCASGVATASTRFTIASTGAVPAPKSSLPDLRISVFDVTRGSIKVTVTNEGELASEGTQLTLTTGVVTDSAEVPSLTVSDRHTTDWLDFVGPAGGLPDEFSVMVNVPPRFSESDFRDNSLLCRPSRDKGPVWRCE